jgi:putative SOS response-associated peptidase YedK
MCGRFASFKPPEAIRGLFRTTNPLPNVAASWNVAPSQDAMVIRVNPETGERNLDLLTWGLVPHWTKDLKEARRPINARADTVDSSPMFKSAYKNRRALIPAEAYYEWTAGQGGMKQPHAIARPALETLAFAGIWEGWRAETGKVIRSFAIVTTAANPAIARIHPRMPVIIAQADWGAWLGEVEADISALLRPAADGFLESWPVRSKVNSTKNNDSSLLERI